MKTLAEEGHNLPALVALVHVLPTVTTNPGVSGHRGAAAWTLQRLSGGLVVLVEIGKLDHQVGCHNWQGKVNLHLSLSGS